MKDFWIAKFKCVKCGYVMDRTTEVKGESEPSAGDISLCLNCGEIYIFNEDLSMHQPSIKELEDISKSEIWPTVQKAQLAIHQKNHEG